MLVMDSFKGHLTLNVRYVIHEMNDDLWVVHLGRCDLTAISSRCCSKKSSKHLKQQ
jgi:hypothetical protein